MTTPIFIPMPMYNSSAGGSCGPITQPEVIGLIIYGIGIIISTILCFWYANRYCNDDYTSIQLFGNPASIVAIFCNFMLSILWPALFIFGGISIFFKEMEKKKAKK